MIGLIQPHRPLRHRGRQARRTYPIAQRAKDSDRLNLVLDTNVIVAAGFAKDSDAAAIVAAARTGRFTLIWDKATEREARRIVEQIPPLNWGEFAGLYREENRYAGELPTERYQAVDGPLDRRFAALADATGSTLITNDDDLLSIRERFDLTIDTPAEFARKRLWPRR